MNRIWLRKTIWSYLPIFCIIFSLLFFVFFQTLVEQNNRNTRDSSKVFVNQLLQSVDVSLRSLDNMLIRDMVSSKLMNDFFLEQGKDNVFLNYQVVNRMMQMKLEMPIIDSYYLVRYKDGNVFSGIMTKLAAFPDIAFIESQQNDKGSYASSWSSFRSFREFPNKQPKQVVSLVHKISISSGMDGMIVVNISLSSIRNMMNEMYDPDRAFVQLYDRGGQPLFTSDNDSGSRKVLASQTSEYTGWTADSGVTNGMAVAVISSLSSIWLMLGLLVFLAGGVSIIYITRKNYKPIADLVFRIQDQFGPGRPALGRLAVDEFTFIETAIDNFAEQTKLFQKKAQETAARRQKAMFMELLLSEGGQTEAAETSALPPHDRLQAFVIEIDNPEQVFSQYKNRDQSLFKFVISSAAHEMYTSRHPIHVWLEWTSPMQLTGILFLGGKEAESAEDKVEYPASFANGIVSPDAHMIAVATDDDAVEETAERITSWVREHLAFSVTIGLGETAYAESGARNSNRQAMEALTFKATLGHNRVIRYRETRQVTVKETNKHLQAIQRLIEQLRLREADWRDRFDDFFSGMRSCGLPKGEIVGLCRYFVAHMDMQLSQASKEYYDVWMNEASATLLPIIEEFDTLGELQHLFAVTLEKYEQRMEQLSNTRQHHQLLQAIREYIGEHYANPELSLEYLGDRFGISAKYISQLFKEEFGENFLDYLSQLRIKEAKKRLLEQPDSIQEVGERVGYVNAATFRRVFRKMEGVSPVDYRKRNAM
ncbi:AraC family transcriptional regulator [Paenibacillus sp. R14(2021)]|uniref:helix-turn-helix domain-containing protein n=1 Tax=Paenibacillus sp. R14(2021) TaxID=2859228 RepID=UPI001C6116B1|nr:helix-turn-helix domain-containing protein [Paenibacillus sp. R14(2021)]